MQAITLLSKQNTYYQTAEKCYESAKIWIAAHRALAELAASFAFNVGLIAFVSSPLSLSALSLASLNFIINSIVQSAYHIYQTKWKKEDDSSTQPGQHMARTSAAFFIGRAGSQIAIHESGHALVAMACFRKANPTISISPFRGGMTSYAVSHGLTSLGSLLGKEKALLLIASSGIMATTVFALFTFAASESLQDHYPNLAACLHYEGISLILSEVLYGLTAFLSSKDDLTHDFIYMWKKGGIHPLIPIGLMIALPMAEILLMKMRKQALKAQMLQSHFKTSLREIST